MGALSGKRVVNTRAIHQAEELDRLLRERGAIPLAYPCVEILPPMDQRPLQDALSRLAAGDFDWLVLTSANTVQAIDLALPPQPAPSSLRSSPRFRPGGQAQRRSALGAGQTKIAAIGPATAAAARQLGLEVAIVPEKHDAQALAAAIPIRPGDRVLLPASEITRPDLAAALADRGAEVTTVTAYRTVVGEGGVDLPRLLAEGGVDAITLASSSAVEGLIARIERAGGNPALVANIPTVCIGKRTRETALERGLTTAVAAERATLDGLFEALERALGPIDAGGTRWSRAS